MTVPSWVRPLAYLSISLDLAWASTTIVGNFFVLHYPIACMIVLFLAFFMLTRSFWEQLSVLLRTHKRTPQVLRFLLFCSAIGLSANIWTGFLPAALVVQATCLWAGLFAREQHALAQGSAVTMLLAVMIGCEVAVQAFMAIVHVS